MQSESALQVVMQAVAPQRYGLHADDPDAGQVPVPLHEAAATCVPAEQLAARQVVDPPAYAQELALVPSQTPPQAEPSLVQAGRDPTGAPLTVVQVPGETPPPLTLQAWHWPLHELLQQTPSTQDPLPHSTAPPQSVPSDLRKP